MRSNRGEEREIGAIQLESPLFEPVEPEARDARLPPAGRPVVMPLPFGTVRCDRRNASGDTGKEHAAVLLADIDGQAVRVPIEQRPSDLLVDLHEAECAAAAVLADVDLRLGDTWRPTDPRTLQGELQFSQRRDGAEATVQGVEGNVIFTEVRGVLRRWEFRPTPTMKLGERPLPGGMGRVRLLSLAPGRR